MPDPHRRGAAARTARTRPLRAAAIGLAAVALFSITGCVGTPAPEAGASFRDCPECPEMVTVPAGRFLMGSPADERERRRFEGPRHWVDIARPFAVGRYEVTFDEWDACVEAGGCPGHRRWHKGWRRLGADDEGWGRGRRPAIKASWNDAKAYVAWLTTRTGRRYRLLSEAEWEYVARAGTTTARHWGEAVGRDNANCFGCGSKYDDDRSAPVGSFAANPFGLHDTLGNVWEWVEDCWNKSYAGAPTDGSAWTDGQCTRRVHRGGSIFDPATEIRAARRDWLDANNRGYGGGFRVAMTLAP